jgi:protein-S-isoprenylcysteine O-methyltransferase Ste14
MKKLLKVLLSAFYGLVMVEVIIMISPFAFYWYSLYAPTLQQLHHWRATAWLDAFFLPHSVITTSPFLEFLRWHIGTYAFSIGVLAFILLGIQVYTSRLLRKRVAQSGLYARIRHPFYLSVAVAAFGLLTMWPRIIILVLFLGMLFLYYFLARLEEKQMEAKFPEYAEYRRRTAMFIPGDPGGKLFRTFFGWIPNRSVALAVSSVVIIVLVIGAGLALRRYTIGRSATELLPEDRTFAIAVWPTSQENMQRVVSTALAAPGVRQALASEPDAFFTAHLLPADYGMVSMFADVGTDHRMFSHLAPRRFAYLLTFVFPYFQHDQKERIMGTPEADYKVVFSRVDEPGRHLARLNQVTDLTAKMTPIVIAEVRAGDSAPVAVTVPPRRSFWGDITMPMF